jgi:hypothetical protein
MDASSYNGDDTREFSDPPACEMCGVPLAQDELRDRICRFCVAEHYANKLADEQHEKDTAA